jgi:hypothetical protein
LIDLQEGEDCSASPRDVFKRRVAMRALVNVTEATFMGDVVYGENSYHRN